MLTAAMIPETTAFLSQRMCGADDRVPFGMRVHEPTALGLQGGLHVSGAGCDAGLQG